MGEITEKLSNSSVSKFWSRPEGRVGLALTVVTGTAVLAFFGSAIGDFFVHALDNTLHLIVAVIAAWAILAMLFDPKLRALVFYLYRSLMRIITSWFITIDPIGVLKTYKERLEGRLAEMHESLSALKGQRVRVIRLTETNDKELDNEMRLVQQARAKGNARVEGLEGRQVVRLQKTKDRYLNDLNRIAMMINVMDRYYELCGDTLTDMDREIKYQIDERTYSQQSRRIVRDAMAILKGLPEKEMWDDATEALEQQYAQAIGEVEGFLDVTKDILSRGDLQHEADAQKAIELLDAWQKKNSGVMLGGKDGGQVSKAEIIEEARKSTAA